VFCSSQDLRAARRVPPPSLKDTTEVLGKIRRAETRADAAEERCDEMQARVAKADAALAESEDRVARLEAKLAKAAVERVERARREGAREYDSYARVPKCPDDGVELIGDENAASEGRTRMTLRAAACFSFSSPSMKKGSDPVAAQRAERRALCNALDATQGRLRELQLRGTKGEAGALNAFRAGRGKTVDPTDKFRQPTTDKT
jgi:seryl-tRNA synthetase